MQRPTPSTSHYLLLRDSCGRHGLVIKHSDEGIQPCVERSDALQRRLVNSTRQLLTIISLDAPAMVSVSVNHDHLPRSAPRIAGTDISGLRQHPPHQCGRLFDRQI
jgi:hypothetical protein